MSVERVSVPPTLKACIDPRTSTLRVGGHIRNAIDEASVAPIRCSGYGMRQIMTRPRTSTWPLCASAVLAIALAALTGRASAQSPRLGPATGLADAAALRATVFGTPPNELAPLPARVP